MPLLDCPADHVVDLERMRTPEVFLREHSILCNPRTPAVVLKGVRREELHGFGAGEGAVDGHEAMTDADDGMDEGVELDGEPYRSVRTTMSKPTARDLMRRLTAVHNATSVLELVGTLPSYRETLGHTKAAAFESELKQFSSLWCCNQPPGGRGPGHVWYDFFWDVVPRTDRHNRRWTGPWTQIMGP